jgi:hypothetical protein
MGAALILAIFFTAFSYGPLFASDGQRDAVAVNDDGSH